MSRRSRRCRNNTDGLTYAAINRDSALPDVEPVRERRGVINDLRRRLSPMNVRCQHCGAIMWPDERISNSTLWQPRFQLCCAKGREVLQPYAPLPSPISEYLEPMHPDHGLFMRHVLPSMGLSHLPHSELKSLTFLVVALRATFLVDNSTIGSGLCILLLVTETKPDLRRCTSMMPNSKTQFGSLTYWLN